MLVGMRHLSTLCMTGVNRLRHVLFPPACPFCQVSLPEEGGCCAQCHAQIRPWPQEHCVCCGVPLPSTMAPGPCGRCLQRALPMQRSESLFVYEGPVRQAILQWKLQGREDAVRWLLAVAKPCIQSIIAPGDMLLPIPMPLGRMRRHGQHHAANLARWLAVISGAAWDWRLLRRCGEQPRQSALSGVERRRNLRKAFTVDVDYWTSVHAQVTRLWLVDDIQTTGSTLYHAARALRGCQRPLCTMTLARTLHGGLYD